MGNELEQLQKELSVKDPGSNLGSRSEPPPTTRQRAPKRVFTRSKPVIDMRVTLNSSEAMMLSRLQKLYDLPYTQIIRQTLREKYIDVFHEEPNSNEVNGMTPR